MWNKDVCQTLRPLVVQSPALRPTWWWPRGSDSSRTAGCDRGTRVGSARTAGPAATRAGSARAQTHCRQTGWAAGRQEQAVSQSVCLFVSHLVWTQNSFKKTRTGGVDSISNLPTLSTLFWIRPRFLPKGEFSCSGESKFIFFPFSFSFVIVKQKISDLICCMQLKLGWKQINFIDPTVGRFTLTDWLFDETAKDPLRFGSRLIHRYTWASSHFNSVLNDV